MVIMDGTISWLVSPLNLIRREVPCSRKHLENTDLSRFMQTVLRLSWMNKGLR